MMALLRSGFRQPFRGLQGSVLGYSRTFFTFPRAGPPTSRGTIRRGFAFLDAKPDIHHHAGRQEARRRKISHGGADILAYLFPAIVVVAGGYFAYKVRGRLYALV
jgi:hypothetical protein